MLWQPRGLVHVTVGPGPVAGPPHREVHLDVTLALRLRHVQPGPRRAQVVAAVGGEELLDTCQSPVVGPVTPPLGVDSGRGQNEAPPFHNALQATDDELTRGMPREMGEGLGEVCLGVGADPAHGGAERLELALPMTNMADA